MLIVCVCSSKHSKTVVDIETIPVDVHNKVTSDASLFIDKIEIVPLETTDSSLRSGNKKTICNKGYGYLCYIWQKASSPNIFRKGRVYW